VQGAVIARVEPGSAADNAGLRRGAIVEQVNRKDVRSASDVQQALSNIGAGQDALLLVWANGGSTFVVMHAPMASSHS
jgi:serine protease Do